MLWYILIMYGNILKEYSPARGEVSDAAPAWYVMEIQTTCRTSKYAA
jgi:hypothetical protein